MYVNVEYIHTFKILLKQHLRRNQGPAQQWPFLWCMKEGKNMAGFQNQTTFWVLTETTKLGEGSWNWTNIGSTEELRVFGACLTVCQAWDARPRLCNLCFLCWGSRKLGLSLAKKGEHIHTVTRQNPSPVNVFTNNHNYDNQSVSTIPNSCRIRGALTSKAIPVPY